MAAAFGPWWSAWGGAVGYYLAIMALVPGACVLVKYPNQPRVWHERLILRSMGDGRHYVATPDQECFPMILTCLPLLDLQHLLPNRRLPPGIRQINTYMIGEDTPDGFFSEAQLAELYAQADAVLAAEGIAAQNVAPVFVPPPALAEEGVEAVPAAALPLSHRATAGC